MIDPTGGFIDLACDNRQLLYWLAAAVIALLVHFGCSIATATTKTPDPSTRAGKAYKLLEAIALITQRAKDTGTPPAA